MIKDLEKGDMGKRVVGEGDGKGFGGVIRFGMLCLYYIYVHNNNNNTVYILVKREREDLRLGDGGREKWKRGCVCWRIYLVKTANNVKLKKEPNLHCYCCAFFFYCCNFFLFWRKGVIIPMHIY